MNFILDIDKAVESSLYVISRVKICDIHKLFKILYFAEQQHLSEYGRTITGDTYIAMPNGPVPSFIYDAVKFVRGDKPYFNIDRDLKSEFDVFRHKYIGAKREANVAYLSASDIECLEKSLAENSHLSFDDLTDKSHDDAWSGAYDNGDMDLFDIASAGGANTEMLKYIQTNIENQKSFK